MTIEEKQLAEFLKKRTQIPLSVNERSFQIFGNEKFLNSSDGKSLLSKYHISLNMLNIYKTPEPFIYYVNPYTNCRNALIIENKDTWYTMRNILKENGTICSFEIHALIYGEGRKIQNSFDYINEEDTKDIHDILTFYYLGDIDSSGIDILYKLKSEYKAYDIQPFEPGYEYLFKHRDKKRKKEMKVSIRTSGIACSLFDFLGDGARVEILNLCNADYIIPQELLNYEVLSNWDSVY
jgi:hypothetical protein